MKERTIEEFLNEMLESHRYPDNIYGIPMRPYDSLQEFTKGYINRLGVNVDSHRKRMGLPSRPKNDPIPTAFEVDREGRKRRKEKDRPTWNLSRQRQREKQVQWQRVENERRRKAQLKKAEKYKREMERRDKERAKKRGFGA